jgi:hypothetical protein
MQDLNNKIYLPNYMRIVANGPILLVIITFAIDFF